MKLSALFALIALFGASLRADDGADAIRSRREAVLSEIVAIRENQLKAGACDETDLRVARIALLEFQRDVAKILNDRIGAQEAIVAEREQILSLWKRREASAVGSRIDLLSAEDSLLVAKSLLLRLRSQKGEPGATDNPDDAQRLREDH